MSALNAAAVSELDIARKLFWLAARDAIFFSTYNEETDAWDDGSYPVINCNDLFVPAANCESLHAEDLDLYVEAVRRHEYAGCAAWCAVKRNANLWRKSTNPEWIEKYNAAVIDIAKMLSVEPPLLETVREIL